MRTCGNDVGPRTVCPTQNKTTDAYTPSSLLSAVLVLLSFVPQTTFYPFALSDLGLIGANKRRWQTKAVLLDFDSCSILKR